MSLKEKQTKMSDYVNTKAGNSNKRTRDNDDENSESKKAKSLQVDINKINYHCDKKNANGKTWNMKLVSWNVAGLRAWLKVIKY